MLQAAEAEGAQHTVALFGGAHSQNYIRRITTCIPANYSPVHPACNASDKDGGTRMGSQRLHTDICSDTSHDSNAENSKDVATPPKNRPRSSTLKELQCLVTQERLYVATYASAAALRPLQHTIHICSQHLV
jgi:hypothetical protein